MKLISSLHNILSLSTSLRFPRATTHLRSMSTSYDAFRVKSHDGKVVRGKVCKAIVGEGKGHENVVMLHGWLDNSASFENFLGRAERFDSASSSNASNSTRRTATFYAIDLPGHGRSDHLGGHTCVLAEYVAYVKDVVASVLRGDDDDRGGERDDGSRTTTTKGKVTIIGHSMGSSIAAMYASAYPEDVERLVMIEGIGPHARGEGDSPGEGIRRHVERRRRGGEGRVSAALADIHVVYGLICIHFTIIIVYLFLDGQRASKRRTAKGARKRITDNCLTCDGALPRIFTPPPPPLKKKKRFTTV